MSNYVGTTDQLCNALQELSGRGTATQRTICLAAIQEIRRLEGREVDASFLIGFLEGDTPVGKDAAKWFRDQPVLDRDA